MYVSKNTLLYLFTYLLKYFGIMTQGYILLHQFIIRFVIKLEKTSIEYFGEKRKSKDVYLPFCLALSIKCFQITIEI